MSPSFHGAVRRAVGIGGRLRGIASEAILDGVYPWKEAHPAAFKPWVRRTTGRPSGGFPLVWRTDSRFPFESPAEVGVVIHVYYAALLPELISLLGNIPTEFDVIVTNASGIPLNESDFRVGNARNVLVLDVENRGRDIFPLIQVVNAGLLDPYLMVLKMHTKKSAWREGHETLGGDGSRWRDTLLDSLVGSEERVKGILNAFGATPQIGCVTADGNVLGEEYWGGDRYLVTELAKRLEVEIAPRELEFAAGSMYWIRGFLLQGLKGLLMDKEDFEDEAGQIDATVAHAVERLIGILTREAGLKTLECSNALLEGAPGHWKRFETGRDLKPVARFIPFYLPQFHPSEANDLWWGKGFTEWTNVSNAKPVFRGHRQPFLPGEIGFYDLRFDSVRERQYQLADQAGIAGFMYYYYWFAGERLLNVPIEALSRQKELPQPFCIMWANENWTRSWDGRARDVLIGQDYDRVPAKDFIEDVAEFLLDQRYMRVDGKAILAVYRPGQIEDFGAVVEHWRERARQLGIGELFVLSVDVAEEFDGLGDGWEQFGLDGSLGFPPHALPWKAAPSHRLALDSRFKGNIVSYRGTAEAGIDSAMIKTTNYFPGVMVGFDNTARRQWKSDVWWGSNPYTFHRWLREAARVVSSREPDERLVFINAWNEWAESAVLEPTQRWGDTYLAAVRNVAFS